MSAVRYAVWIGETQCIGDDLSYETLLVRVMEFTVRAAIARSADDGEWEHEQLRRHGIGALQIFRNGKTLWGNVSTFNEELAEARREGAAEPFQARNELDPELYAQLDRDLRARWRRLGYDTESLREDMKRLFCELEHDAADRAADARERLLADLFAVLKEMP